MLLLPQEGKREEMSKAPQTQRGTDKSHRRCRARAVITPRVDARKRVFACEVGDFVLPRVLWQAGRCERWEAGERLA